MSVVLFSCSLLKFLSSPELAVEFFEGAEYASGCDGFPPPIIPFNSVVCQLARGTIDCVEPPVWITTTMARVCTFIFYVILHELTFLQGAASGGRDRIV